MSFTKIAELETGEILYREWDGQKWRFYLRDGWADGNWTRLISEKVKDDEMCVGLPELTEKDRLDGEASSADLEADVRSKEEREQLLEEIHRKMKELV